MKKLIHLLILLAMSIFLTACSQSKVDITNKIDINKPASEESIKKYLEYTNSAKELTDLVNKLFNIFEIKAKNENEKNFFKEARKDFDGQEFIEIVIPIYQKYFTELDMQEMNNFHKSRIGKKVQKVNPELKKELRKEGKKYGMKFAIELMMKIKEQNKN